MLLVDGDAARSSLWGCVRGHSALQELESVSPAGLLFLPRQRCQHRIGPLEHKPEHAYARTHTHISTMHTHACAHTCLHVAHWPSPHSTCGATPRCSSCPGSPGRRRQCWPAPPGPRPAAASRSQPAACSSWGRDRQAQQAGPPPHSPPRDGPPHLVGDTTSKQNLRSMSSQGFTEHRRRSSTTTVSASCGRCTVALSSAPKTWSCADLLLIALPWSQTV